MWRHLFGPIYVHGEKGAAVTFRGTGDAAHLGELGQTFGLQPREQHALNPHFLHLRCFYEGLGEAFRSPLSFRCVGESPERR